MVQTGSCGSRVPGQMARPPAPLFQQLTIIVASFLELFSAVLIFTGVCLQAINLC